MTELIIIFLLIILNGLFAMAEAAVIASRRARLQQRVEAGDKGAQAALKLAEEPNRFLATVQIGITLIGILSGAFGGATIAGQIAAQLRDTALAPYAEAIGFAVIVLFTTYLSLVIGELVPKRLALHSPERISALVARPMGFLSRVTSPVVSLLSFSTDFVLRLLGQRPSEEPPVSEEEIKTMIQQGIEAGVFDETEHDMVEGIFRLDDRRVNAVMTPRTEIAWINIEDDEAAIKQVIVEHDASRFPVCERDLDHVIGIVHAKDLLSRLLAGEPFNIHAIHALLHEPLFVPESMAASSLLEQFKLNNKQMALVIGEYGGVQGLVTLQDLLEEIVGDIEQEQEPSIVRREDGSWLLDGMVQVDELKDLLLIEDDLPGEHEGFETLGGFVLSQLGRIPDAGDRFNWAKWRFEVMDMDGNRVDKVLVSAIEPPDEIRESEEDEVEERE